MPIDKQQIIRSGVKAALAPLLRWAPLRDPAPGFSIVLGTPWALRHLLTVNLRFIAQTDTRELDRVFVMFDRTRQPGADAFIESVKSRFPDLPLAFHFHPPFSGRIVRAVNRSKFYASMNWTHGIKACRTKYAVMHDFDLYPIKPDFFTKIVDAMRSQGLRFSGAEHTKFDGLNTADALIGTWELGIDVEWIRSTYRPIDCFHAVRDVNGRRVDLDAFSAIQDRTPQRALAPGAGPDNFAHVTNLCSTYLLYSAGEPVRVAWRLHYLWYLESLADDPRDLDAISAAMENADSSVLTVDGRSTDFAKAHVTCVNVLEPEVTTMDRFLFGEVRPQTRRFVEAFGKFLGAHGDRTERGPAPASAPVAG